MYYYYLVFIVMNVVAGYYTEGNINQYIDDILIKIPIQIDIYNNDSNKTTNIIDICFMKNDNSTATILNICNDNNLDDNNCKNLLSYCHDQIDKINIASNSTIVDDDEYRQGVRTIWLFWYQGLENAPDVVKAAIKSWKHYHDNSKWNIIILDKWNMRYFVNFNDMHISSSTLNTISTNDLILLSDLIRVYLLYKYGGVWIDATVLCHRSLDTWLYNDNNDGSISIIGNNTFFAFRNSFVKSNIGIKLPLCGWFMASNIHVDDNYIMIKIYEKTREYWFKRIPISYDYFWLHTIIDNLINEDVKFSNFYYNGVMHTNSWILQQYFNVDIIMKTYQEPDVTSIFQAAHLLQLSLLHPINDDLIEFIDTTNVPVSKLTYKYDKTKNITSTVLQYILNKYL